MQKKWLICLLLSTLLAPQVRAATGESARQFDIEMILFTNLNAYDGGEEWKLEQLPERSFRESSGNPESSILDGSRPDSMATLDHGWIALPASAQKLNAIEGSLSRSSGYRPLAHLLWRQTVQDPKAALPVDVLALQGYSAGGSLPVPHLEGTILVSVSRYLHVATDLRLVEATQSYVSSTMNGTAPGIGAAPVYRMQQQRRMRSGELHYIDHPRFGLLVQITPYTPPEQEPMPVSGPENIPSAGPVSLTPDSVQ